MIEFGVGNMESKGLTKIFKAAGLNHVDEELVKDVARIIEWQQILKEVNIEGVQPMYNTLGENAKYISNEDVVVKETGDIFVNAVEKEVDGQDTFFVVLKVL